MKRKAVSGIMLSLLLISMLTLAFNVQPVKASGTIYIRSNGSIDPPTAPIQRDGNVYTFTDNIYDSIVVERDNIVVDGVGYTVQGTGEWSGYGISLFGRINVTIKNMEIKAFEFGIVLQHSSNNSISGNNITNNDYGISLGGSSNNSISGNNITANNGDGIELGLSSNNSISGNNITNNGGGIWLDSSSNNILRGNSIANNYYSFMVRGSSLSDFVNDVDVSNTVDGKPVYYWISKRDMAVPLDAGYVALVNCTRITVQNLNLTKNGQGLLLAYTTNSTVTKNNITNNDYGIELKYSSNYNSISGNNITANNWYGIELYGTSNNTISGNDIAANNGVGVWLWYSSNTIIYHNNFIDNTDQVLIYESFNTAWDDGYPSGGNYWSDYSGVDADADGIGDTPYFIDANNQDNYPLMEPWTPLPRTIGELKTEIEELGSEDEIDNQGIVKSLVAKLKVTEKLVDKGKVEEAKMVLEDFIIQVQELSGIHIIVEAADILIQSAEHILSHI